METPVAALDAAGWLPTCGISSTAHYRLRHGIDKSPCDIDSSASITPGAQPLVLPHFAGSQASQLVPPRRFSTILNLVDPHISEQDRQELIIVSIPGDL